MDLEKGRTGFCPINIEVGAPTFPLFYMDAEGKLFEQPVEHNGKYKMVPYISPEGSFPVTGFVPQYIANQSSEDYDININVPTDGSEPVQPIQPNTCYFNLSDYVIDQINATDDGKLRLPNGNQDLMQAVSFDTGDKEYATDLVVDLSNVHVVKNNTASFNITPEVLDIVNSNGYQNEGQIVLPSDTIIKTMTNYDDDDKGFCTDIVINVNSLKDLIPQPTLNIADTNINQNDTYQIGNFDNNDSDVEIQATDNRNLKKKVLSIRKLGDEMDRDPDPTVDTNYVIGTFTVDVKPLAKVWIRPTVQSYDATDIFDAVLRPYVMFSGELTFNNNGEFEFPLKYQNDRECFMIFAGIDGEITNSTTQQRESDNSLKIVLIRFQYHTPTNNTDYVRIHFENSMMNMDHFMIIGNSGDPDYSIGKEYDSYTDTILKGIMQDSGNGNDEYNYEHRFDHFEEGGGYSDLRNVDLSYLKTNWPTIKQTLKSVTYGNTTIPFSSFEYNENASQYHPLEARKVLIKFSSLEDDGPENQFDNITVYITENDPSNTPYIHPRTYYYVTDYVDNVKTITVNNELNEPLYNINTEYSDYNKYYSGSLPINKSVFNIITNTENTE